MSEILDFKPVLLAWSQMMCEELSAKKCRRLGVRGLIQRLKRGLPENGIGPYINDTRQAAQLLESHCRLCGKCRDRAR